MLPVCFRAPKTAILYIRTFSGDQSAFTAKMQEFMLRKFCDEKKIQVIDTIRTHVDEAESIRFSGYRLNSARHKISLQEETARTKRSKICP